jgi:hypothetical protein
VNFFTTGGRNSSSVGHDTENGADAAGLLEDVGAEAPHARELVDEVDLALGLEALALLGRQDFEQEAAGVGLGEHAEIERHQIAVVADDGRHAGVEVQIAGLLLDDQAQERV